jgi:putative serine protease PepD
MTEIQRIVSSEGRESLGIDTGTDLSVNVAAKVVPSVVSISVVSQQVTPMGTMQGEGSGSGVIIQDNGYILTNYHVVDGSSKIVVTAGAKDYDATVIGSDPTSDLAVLKIDATNLPVVDIGTSADLKVGQYVMAVGSPFGLSESVTVGIISALGRTEAIRSGSLLSAYADLIQTDAAVNPGNSGGALVDADGRLIGINTFIMTTSGSSAGVGFAIPIDTALDIAQQLMEGGTASHSFLGVSTQTIDAATAKQFNMPTESGAYVVEVVSGSPAEAAGLKRGDILIKVGKKSIKTSEDVFAAVRAHKAGETVTVEYYRDDELMKAEVTLASDANVATTNEPAPSMPPATEEATPQANPHEGLIPQELLDLLREYGF